jgi:hypothetical protein
LRRLDTRRQPLLENLFTLFLDDDYMRIRHGRSYHAWKEIPSSEEHKKKFELDYFNKDFKAQNGHQDFFPPVALTTVLSGAGWYFVLSHVYPAAGSPELTQLVPETLAWGFVGAFFASVLAISKNSTPTALRLRCISDKTAQGLGAAKPEGEKGAGLAAVQGLEDSRDRQKLVSLGITTVQALATADPLLLFFRTTLPIRTVVDLIDKAILYLYIGDKVKELRTNGINGMIELVGLVKSVDKTTAFASGLAPGGGNEFSKLFEEVNAVQLIKDVAKSLGQSEDELKAFMYNMYYDPVLIFIYEVWGRYGQPSPI